MYVVVETEDFQEKKVSINVKQGKEKGIEEEHEAIMLKDDQDQYHTQIITTVGGMKDTEYHNKDDFADMAIFKVSIDTVDKDRKKRWTDALEKAKDKKVPLYLLVDAHTLEGQTEMHINYLGDTEEGEIRGEKVTNRWLDVDGAWFELNGNKRAPWMEIVFREVGVEEIPGKNHNPKILDYHVAAKFNRDSVTDDGNWPWCASFASWVMKKAGYELPRGSGKATNWKNWEKADSKEKPIYGSIAVIDWGKNGGGKGHIAFFVGKKGNDYYLLGGNQTGGDKTTKGKVCIGKYSKSVIDYFRIPKDYTPSEIDYVYDKITNTKSSNETLQSTR